MNIYIITWKYSDGSNSGIVGAYATHQGADAVMAFLAKHGDVGKTFIVDEVRLEDYEQC